MMIKVLLGYSGIKFNPKKIPHLDIPHNVAEPEIVLSIHGSDTSNINYHQVKFSTLK